MAVSQRRPRSSSLPETVEEIQAVLRDTSTYPSPVRAKGSYHSLTPCASSDGTIVDMSRMQRIIDVDPSNNVLTAQAGVHIIDAARALQKFDRQLMTNIEIGNMTLGSAACCHSKDALDGVEFGQVSSYVTRIKWVTPAGELAEASEAENPAAAAPGPFQLWTVRHRVRGHVAHQTGRSPALHLHTAARGRADAGGGRRAAGHLRGDHLLDRRADVHLSTAPAGG